MMPTPDKIVVKTSNTVAGTDHILMFAIIITEMGCGS